MTYNKSTRKINTPKMMLVRVKIVGQHQFEGMDTEMPPQFVLKESIAVDAAIRAWRNEFGIKPNHRHRHLTKILVQVVKGDTVIGVSAMTQDEEDRQEELAELQRIERMYEDEDNTDELAELIGDALTSIGA